MRVLLIPLVLWLCIYHARYSRETLIAHRTFISVPFLVEPFTNTIVAIVGGEHSGLTYGDRLIAVNGRRFTGISVYEQELLAANAATGPGLTVTVISKDGVTRDVSPGLAHCTCGIPSLAQVLRFWVLPPLFCLVLGIALVWKRPQSKLAWAFLALMLSASQLAVLPEPIASFRQSVDVRGWETPALRIGAVLHQTFWATSWPAWLILFATLWFPRGTRQPMIEKPALILLAWFIGIACVSSAFAIGWSESYRGLASAHEWAMSVRLEVLLLSIAATAVVAGSMGVGTGASVVVAAAVTLCMLFWPADAPTTVERILYTGNITRTEPVLPPHYRTTELVIAIFASLSFLSAAVSNWRSLTKPFRAGLASLTIALVVPLIAWSRQWTHLIWNSTVYMDGSLVLGGCGLICIAWSVFKRTEVPANLQPPGQHSVCSISASSFEA